MAMRIMLALLMLFGLCNTTEAVEAEGYRMEVIGLECEKYGLSQALVYGVIMAESGFDVNADSGSSKGVMQLNKNTYPELVKDLGMASFDVFDYEDNVAVGVYYLAYLRDYWLGEGYLDEDVVHLMLISYNRGIAGCGGYVADHGLENGYVDRVLGYKWALEGGTLHE